MLRKQAVNKVSLEPTENKITMSRTISTGMLSATLCGGVADVSTSQSAGPKRDNEASDMLVAMRLYDSHSGRTRAGCGSGQLVDEEVKYVQGAGDGGDWVAEIACTKDNSGAIFVAFMKPNGRIQWKRGILLVRRGIYAALFYSQVDVFVGFGLHGKALFVCSSVSVGDVILEYSRTRG